MFNRNGAISMAVLAAVAATASVALADSKTPTLTLEPTVALLDDAPAPRAPLMAGLDRLGAAKSLDDLKLNIYGWVEGGYTYGHRHQNRESSVSSNAPKIVGGGFNHEAGDTFMFNQLIIRFERQVDTTKVDVGGMIEIMYGQDAAGIHATGLGYNGDDASQAPHEEESGKAGDRYHPNYQFDIVQAYVDVAVGFTGLKFRAGKMVTMTGYEYLNPNNNPFYSKSFISQVEPVTHTGIMAMYDINDQWHVTAGISRGWDIALEDNNGGAIDFIGQLGWTPNKQLSAYLNVTVGPENAGDTAHYRTFIDPVVTYQVTDKFAVGMEAIYYYDGGGDNSSSGAFQTLNFGNGTYGDAWGAAGYASYVINDYATANARLEKLHYYLANNSITDGGLNVYEVTLGVTIKPFPKDQWGSGLKIRPEVRYDYSDNSFGIFNGYKDQLTFGADIIYSF